MRKNFVANPYDTHCASKPCHKRFELAVDLLDSGIGVLASHQESGGG